MEQWAYIALKSRIRDVMDNADRYRSERARFVMVWVTMSGSTMVWPMALSDMRISRVVDKIDWFGMERPVPGGLVRVRLGCPKCASNVRCDDVSGFFPDEWSNWH